MKSWYKLLNREDFDVIANENGFQITFKGNKIGGAGWDPGEKVFPTEESKQKSAQGFHELGIAAIIKILTGEGDSRYYKKIKELAGL